MRRAHKPQRKNFPMLFGGVLIATYVAAWAFLTMAWDDWDRCSGNVCVASSTETAGGPADAVSR